MNLAAYHAESNRAMPNASFHRSSAGVKQAHADRLKRRVDEVYEMSVRLTSANCRYQVLETLKQLREEAVELASELSRHAAAENQVWLMHLAHGPSLRQDAAGLRAIRDLEREHVLALDFIGTFLEQSDLELYLLDSGKAGHDYAKNERLKHLSDNLTQACLILKARFSEEEALV
ncbi:hypothetical protein [Paenibacillus xanthanilyticus]|uniref:Uncharacterized protein n=1 Tax=Paenibacillus xanthanilyticus TaxID=1783531 RepID=A0ABV8K6N2_9BACL